MADTSVLTLTGARAIEALRPGDLVICRDETRQMSVVKPVVRLIRNHHQKILSLTLLGSSRDELLADLPDKTEEIIGGRGYDSNRIRLWLAERTITACIPPKKNRKSKPPYDWHVYKKRHLIENMFAKLKGWRRVATRYDRCAHTFICTQS